MNLDFAKGDGLLPAVIQDSETNVVLMLGYMNKEAYEKTIREKLVTFFSRTKQRLWTKGETSGNTLSVVDILTDCDNDTILIKVKPAGPVCHTGDDTCFKEQNVSSNMFLSELQKVIYSRKNDSADKSYTKRLFDKGVNKIAQKVVEEAGETIIEALNGDVNLLKEESADLLYHLLVLLAEKNISIEDVDNLLRERNSK